MTLIDTLTSLLATPTAPYREHWMIERVRSLLQKAPGVEIRNDRWGNIAVRLRRGDSHPPTLALVAHLDHPGFLPADAPQGKRIPILFEGGVNDEFFLGARIRLFRSPDDPGVPAVITEMSPRQTEAPRNRIGMAEAETEVADWTLGMWDLDPVRIEGDLIHSRGLDDVAGAGLIVETMLRLTQREEPTDTIALLTRAEETGYTGTLLLLADDSPERLLPPGTRSICVEMSSARPNTPVGEGAVLRVGDRTAVYDNALCRQVFEVSQALAERENRRPLVRALMDGGTCEATPLMLFGHPSAGLCLPLINYHNMDHSTRAISEECVSISDAEDLVAVMTQLAIDVGNGAACLEHLRSRLVDLAKSSAHRLISPA